MGKSRSAKQQVTEYRMSIHYGLCLGPVDAIRQIKIGDKVAWSGNTTTQSAISINAPQLFGGERKEGGVGGTAYFLPGNDTQVLPDNLAARFNLTSLTAPAFRGFASLFFVGNDYEAPGVEAPYVRTNSGFLDDVYRGAARFTGFYWGHNTPFIREADITLSCSAKGLDESLEYIPNEDFPNYPDANPAHIIFECLTNPEYGKGDPLSMFDIDEWNAVAQTLYDEKFGLSLAWFNQAEIESFIDEIIDHIQAALFIHPVTGKWTLKLFRDDYDPETLDTFNMDNATLKSFQRKAWGEIVNEIVLTWTNPLNEEEETVTMQDLGAIAAQGDLSSATRNMYAIRKKSLANVICARELAQSSAALAAAEIEVSRSNWQKLPGDVIRLDWAEHELSGLVFRIMKVGKPSKSGKINVSLVEDIFSLTKPALQPDTSSLWEDPSEDPEALEHEKLFTLPYAMAAAVAESVGEENITYPNALTGVLAYHSSADVIEIEVFSEITRPDGRVFYERIGAKPVAGYATLAAAFDAEASTDYSAVPGAATGRTPVEGGLALLGSGADSDCEFCLVTADPVEGWVLKRGVYDTVPRSWPIGTPIWFFDEANDVSDISQTRGLGESANYKLLARTSKGTLDPAIVSASAVTVSDRPHRPNRPANVKVNGTGFASVSIDGLTEVTVSWSRRNRLMEDSIPTDWDAADVIPEPGQTTIIRAVNSAGTELARWEDVPGTSKTISTAAFAGEGAIYLHLFSARDDLASLQTYGIWLLEAGASVPGSLPDLGDLDDLLSGTSDLVEGGGNTGRNLCPDPYFQDPELWGLGAGPWYSVSRAGSAYPGELGTPKALVLSDEHYSGSDQQTAETSTLAGLFGEGKALQLSARAKNDGSGSATITLAVQFYRSQDGTAVGAPSSITWTKGEAGYKSLKVTPPTGADSKRFLIYNQDGVTWAGSAGISDIQLVEYEVPSSGSVSDLTRQAIEDADAALQDDVDATNDRINEAAETLEEGNTNLTTALQTERARINRNVNDTNSRIDAVKAASGAAFASIERVMAAMQKDGRSLTLFVQRQTSSLAGSIASIESDYITSVSLNDALVAFDFSLNAGFEDAVAGTTAIGDINSSLAVLADADRLLARKFESLSGRIGAAMAQINERSIISLRDNEALAKQTLQYISKVEGALATLTSTFVTGADLTQAFTDYGLTSTSVFPTLKQDVEDLSDDLSANYYTKSQADLQFTTQADVNSTFAAYGLSLTSSFPTALSRIGDVEAELDPDNPGSVAAQVQDNAATSASADRLLAKRLENVLARAGALYAGIENLRAALLEDGRATAASISRVSAILNGVEGVVETLASVLIDENGVVSTWLEKVTAGAAEATVRLNARDVNGVATSVIRLVADSIGFGEDAFFEYLDEDPDYSDQPNIYLRDKDGTVILDGRNISAADWRKADILTKAQKLQSVPYWQSLIDEKTALVARATALSLSSTTYSNAVDALVAELDSYDAGQPDWDDLTGDTEIDSATLMPLVSAVETARNALHALIRAALNWNDLLGRPTWVTDGRVPAGILVNGDIARDVPAARVPAAAVTQHAGAINVNSLQGSGALAEKDEINEGDLSASADIPKVARASNTLASNTSFGTTETVLMEIECDIGLPSEFAVYATNVVFGTVTGKSGTVNVTVAVRISDKSMLTHGYNAETVTNANQIMAAVAVNDSTGALLQAAINTRPTYMAPGGATQPDDTGTMKDYTFGTGSGKIYLALTAVITSGATGVIATTDTAFRADFWGKGVVIQSP